jgi:hypothetical protein
MIYETAGNLSLANKEKTFESHFHVNRTISYYNDQVPKSR